METQDSPHNGPGNDDESIVDRVSRLENRVAHLEKAMESIAKMENALGHIFGGKEPKES